MFVDHLIRGESLPAKTLCLTYDDGPEETPGADGGPQSLKLAEYLHAYGIRATFFVIGRRAERFARLLPRLKELGHLIANHTWEHRQLVEWRAAGGSAVEQVTRTDEIIGPWVDRGTVYVRPPYGEWSPELAACLNAELSVALSHVGPVGWDVDGRDWECWAMGMSPHDAAVRHLDEIERRGKGIVILHDACADSAVPVCTHRTWELTQILVPELLARGYHFCRLDEVPLVACAAQVPLEGTLSGSNGSYLSARKDGRVSMSADRLGRNERWAVLDLGNGRIALRSAHGSYLSEQARAGSVTVKAGEIGDLETFELCSLIAGGTAFRTATGLFLGRDENDNSMIIASSEHLGEREIFQFSYLPPNLSAAAGATTILDSD